MNKPKVLFVCIHNSARSQIAEALLKDLAPERFDVESAGLEPGTLNPLAIAVMRELGIDISGNKTKKVFDFIKNGSLFSYVITVCDEASAESCPVFPGITKRLHWSFEDPSTFTGTEEEKLALMRDVRDRMKRKIEEWLRQSL